MDQNAFDANHPRMVKLPRAVACELCLVATLMPLAVTELSAPYHTEVFCSDASEKKGAFCKAVIPEHIVRVLWKSERSKGAYSRLLSPSEVLLKRMDELDIAPEGTTTSSPSRPLAFHFDFVEIFAGASLITKFLAEKGYSCGPPIEISASELLISIILNGPTLQAGSRLWWPRKGCGVSFYVHRAPRFP